MRFYLLKVCIKSLIFALPFFKVNQNMKKIFLFLTALIFVASCSNKVIDVKSPCVSNDDGPCGPKKSINDWWLKNSKQHKQNS